MRACSFLPGATDMIYRLGLDRHLYGITFECPGDKPKVVRSRLEGCDAGSEEIDRLVKAYVQEGQSLHYIDMDLFCSIEPDVIFTQHVCDVCQIGTSYVEQAIAALPNKPQIVPLVPKSLSDVFDNALTIARTLGDEDAAIRLLDDISERLDRIADTLRASRTGFRKVMFVEWMKPIFNCGHWIPDQIRRAGGMDMVANPQGHSFEIRWETVKAYDPEIIVIAPCGFTLERTFHDMGCLTELSGWRDLTAVRSGEVYAVDADLFTRPSTSLAEGIELLAAIFHPNLFRLPKHLQTKVARFTDTSVSFASYK